MLYQWCLEWPSRARGQEGQLEIRRGVDLLHFSAGKINVKRSYSKTVVTVGGQRTVLSD